MGSEVAAWWTETAKLTITLNAYLMRYPMRIPFPAEITHPIHDASSDLLPWLTCAVPEGTALCVGGGRAPCSGDLGGAPCSSDPGGAGPAGGGCGDGSISWIARHRPLLRFRQADNA